MIDNALRFSRPEAWTLMPAIPDASADAGAPSSAYARDSSFDSAGSGASTKTAWLAPRDIINPTQRPDAECTDESNARHVMPRALLAHEALSEEQLDATRRMAELIPLHITRISSGERENLVANIEDARDPKMRAALLYPLFLNAMRHFTPQQRLRLLHAVPVADTSLSQLVFASREFMPDDLHVYERLHVAALRMTGKYGADRASGSIAGFGQRTLSRDSIATNEATTLLRVEDILA